ncbi:ribose 1,5-bisphosphokinase [Roseinatronobacter thiooxidans]|uniref:Ribose 1,5-bisphosphate phosphokinase PhnN n=1 Tax=Roseinatronobacter thiooxidans TaxID=121821 RepID=A0A2W7QHF1_9RHOB|nr:phosphonate metabolism protein/1,5-bisphosphokinase (PRPP-forming) PhnN [Roseinatronobacter thiooxidans]PZX38015.1 ribose 1,5-bisphosphokinase [Roseinatronobacter thiooxidans]
MSGLLIAVVGPSGVGKDTLLDALARARPDIKVVQRIITRAADAGGEAHLAHSEAEFEAQRAAGHYAFHWQAHGARYAIPASIDADLAQGHVVVFNGSRKALPDIQKAYPGLLVLMVTAAPEVLAQRLQARGRETDKEIGARLKRAELAAPAGAIMIRNDTTPDAALAQMLAVITRATARA